MAGQVRSRRRGLVALSVVAGLLAVAWLGTWLRLDEAAYIPPDPPPPGWPPGFDWRAAGARLVPAC
jgi:hypothetical protein